MTDTEQKRINEICKVANVDDISDLSDGYHTFRQLYYQRMMLFAAIVKQNRDKAWKSKCHADGEPCFGGGWFIVGIDTPEGSYTYHYKDTYFDLFECEELERGKMWDGHTEKDVTRLLSLEQQHCDDAISRENTLKAMIEQLGIRNEDYLLPEEATLYKVVKNMPPVTPQPKMGRWIKTHQAVMGEGYMWYCDKCEHKVYQDSSKPYPSEKYCPNCGQPKMKEVEDK